MSRRQSSSQECYHEDMIDYLLYKVFYFLYKGIYEFEGPDRTRIILAKNIFPKWAAAQALGNNIFVRCSFDPKEYFPHEYVHVLQYRKYGIMFFVLYGLESLKQFLKGKHYYFDNKFEVEARERYSEMSYKFFDFEWPDYPNCQ
jgi:hypothetical protein